MKDSSVSVVRRRHRRRSRKNAGAKFLVVLLFAATAAITWQFARQSRFRACRTRRPELNQIKLNETDPATSAVPTLRSSVRVRGARLICIR